MHARLLRVFSINFFAAAAASGEVHRTPSDSPKKKGEALS